MMKILYFFNFSGGLWLPPQRAFKIALLAALVGFSSAGSQEEPRTLCFFEMGNTKASDNLISKTGAQGSGPCKLSSDGVRICPYQIKEGESALQAVERMIKDNQKCDGLSFSGHHTGDWGGSQELKLKDLEALSCRPEYRNWFQNIKALWLDGCNTVTDEYIKPERSADSESARVVGKKKDRTYHNSYFIRSLQQAYSASLDQNTNLSSRYLRMFPETQIYGFVGPAPAVDGGSDGKQDQVGGQSWIYNHLIHLSQAIPADSMPWLRDFKRGLSALFRDDYCDEEALLSWQEPTTSGGETRAVGHYEYGLARKLGCDLILAKQVLDSPSANSAQALAQRIRDEASSYNEDIVKLAREVLAKPNERQKAIQLAQSMVLQTLDSIERADQGINDESLKLSFLLFNNLYDTWSAAQGQGGAFFRSVKEKFKAESLTRSIEARIDSDLTASLRRGDYIKFYTQIHDIDMARGTGEKADRARGAVSILVEKALGVFEDLRSLRGAPPEQAKRALAVSVVEQLLQYNLLSEGQMEQLLASERLFPRDTQHPFFIDTYARLSLKKDPAQALEEISTYSDPLWKTRSVRAIGAVYVNDLDRLDQLARQVDIRDEDIARGFTFLFHYDVFSRKSDEDQVKKYLRLREQASQALEEVLDDYFYDYIPAGSSLWRDTCIRMGWDSGNCETKHKKPQ